MYTLQTFLLGLAGMCFGACGAGSLVEDFRTAIRTDPTYAMALAEFDSGALRSRIASMAYFPEARISATQLDNEGASRTTISVLQPLLSYDRWLTLTESDPLLGLALSKLSASQSELALRIYKVIAVVLEAKGRLQLNESTLQTIHTQYQSAVARYRLGQGTITDVRDTEVRLSQIRAQAISLRGSLQSGIRQYEAILGLGTALDRLMLFRLSDALVSPPDLPHHLDQSSSIQRHPAVRVAEQSLRLAEIAAKRARASQYPSVVASAQRSKIDGNQSLSSSGIVLRMEVPIQAASIFRGASADLELRRVQQQQRETIQRISLDIARLSEQLLGAYAELVALNEAVIVAQQSVEATEKSFSGGVRTRIDVLNSLQTVYQLKTDYLTSLLRYGELHLSLDLAGAVEPEVALGRLESALFSRAN